MTPRGTEPYTNVPPFQLPDGQYVVGINGPGGPLSLSLKVDASPPTIVLDPVSGSTIERGADGTVDVTCSDVEPPSGSGLASCSADFDVDTALLGTTTGTVTAEDVAGNVTSFDYSYEVVDTTPPTITLSPPSGSTIERGASGAVVVTCADPGGFPVVSCSPNFTVDTSVIGSRTGTLAAVDGANNTTNLTYTYQIVDTVPPVFDPYTPPAPVQAVGTGAAVTFPTPRATDPPDGVQVPVTCVPASGSNFAIGTTQVTCTATDAAGNTATLTFPVVVVAAPCDPSDNPNPAVDIVDCRVSIVGNSAFITLGLRGAVSSAGPQYRLRVSNAANKTGTQVKWSQGAFQGQPLVAVTVNGNEITFEIDLLKVGVRKAGDKLYWSAETQDGAPGAPQIGFPDRAPDSGGYFPPVVRP